MRTRAVTPLRKIARDGVRSKTARPMATDHLTSANGSGLTMQQRLGLARHRCSAAGMMYTLPPTSNRANGVGLGALPSPVEYRFHSSCCYPLLSSADGDARHVERATAGCLRSAASPRKMSTLAEASSKVGSATANGITFETGKVSWCAHSTERPEPYTREESIFRYT